MHISYSSYLVRFFLVLTLWPQYHGQGINLVFNPFRPFLLTGCHPKCESNPCYNNGICLEWYSRYTCDCAYTPFRGWDCGRGLSLSPYFVFPGFPWHCFILNDHDTFSISNSCSEAVIYRSYLLLYAIKIVIVDLY